MHRFRLIFLLLATGAALAQTAPVPYIAAPLSPSTLPPGSQGFVMTVHGDNFGPTAVLEWNGNQKETVVTSSTLLTATIDTSDLTKPGTAQVTVVNLGKRNRVSNTALFTLRKPAPTVSIVIDPAVSAKASVSSVVADFNNDGIPDVATCTPDHFGSVIAVYLGEGHGKFQAPIKSVFTGVNKVASGPMFAGDFNNDGSLDLVVGSALERSSTVIFGDGKGHFRNPVLTANSLVPYAVGDINGDGKLDLLAGGYLRGAGFSVVQVWLGNGDGTFGRGSQLSLGMEGSPILGDFNEDGNLDIAVPRTERQSVMVFLNEGNGVFGYKDFKTYSAPLAFGIATADINGDGHLDIVSDKGGVLIGRGDGTFARGKDAPNQTGTGIRPPALIAPGTDVAVADFNGDGNQDVLVMGNELALYLGNGDGTLQPASICRSGSDGVWRLRRLRSERPPGRRRGWRDLLADLGGSGSVQHRLRPAQGRQEQQARGCNPIQCRFNSVDSHQHCDWRYRRR